MKVLSGILSTVLLGNLFIAPAVLAVEEPADKTVPTEEVNQIIDEATGQSTIEKLEDSQQETMPEETNTSTPETEATQEEMGITEESSVEKNEGSNQEPDTTDTNTERVSKENSMTDQRAVEESYLTEHYTYTYSSPYNIYVLTGIKKDDNGVIRVPHKAKYGSKIINVELGPNFWPSIKNYSNASSITDFILDSSDFFFMYGGISKMIDFSYLFTKYSSLKTVDLSLFTWTSVSNMEGMFKNCTKLETVKLGINSANIGGSVKQSTQNVTSMASLFEGCTSLKSIEGFTDVDMSFNNSCASMFKNCKSLVNIDNNQLAWRNTNMVENMSYMFDSCGSLTSLDLSSFNTTGVNEMAWMFRYCESLTSLDVSSFNTAGVNNMHGMFNSCYSLTNLDVSKFDMRSVTNARYMLGNLPKVQFFDLRNWNLPTTADITGLFAIDNGKAPLVILGNDDRLIQGTTRNRYLGGPKFVAGNNGYFGTAETKEKYYFNMLEKDPKKLEVASFEAFKTKLIPEVVDSTTKFLRWDGDKITTSEELVKEHVYQAKYLFDITAPGDGDQNVLPSSEYGISYVPKAFSVQGKLSNETDVQSIAIPGNFHVAVRDRRNQLGGWTLSAQLQWTGTPLTAAEIQITGGAVKKNSTNGQMNQESNLTDCPTSEVTGYSNVVIGSTPKPIMSANGSVTHDAIYDYSLGGVSLRINQPKDVAAGKYDGKIVWNLSNTLN
ncbi:BspA family leucine-rich repeat surface protein [Enterococcus faecalis]